MPEKHAEESGSEKPGKEPAQEPRSIEEAAEQSGTLRALRIARLSRLRHAALHGQCRGRRGCRGRSGKGAGAATANAAAASRACHGIGGGECECRGKGDSYKNRTKAEHFFLLGEPVPGRDTISVCGRAIERG